MNSGRNRRMVLIPVAIAMAHRAQWLTQQPFEPRGVTVPWTLTSLFVIGAIINVVLFLWPRHWKSTFVALVSVSSSAPYIFYCAWAVDTFPWASVRGTVLDLLLIPILIAFSWGRIANTTLRG